MLRQGKERDFLELSLTATNGVLGSLKRVFEKRKQFIPLRLKMFVNNKKTNCV